MLPDVERINWMTFDEMLLYNEDGIPCWHDRDQWAECICYLLKLL